MQDNYAVMQERSQALFLTYDGAALCRRLNLPFSEGEIFIRFLGEDCRVQRNSGAVLDSRGQRMGFNSAMSIYDVLCREGDTPRLSGEFVPTMSLHGIMGSNSVHEDLNRNAGFRFAGKEALLRAACEARGGIAGTKGDVCYTLPVFDFFPVQLRFWAADEEFPPQLQFFWDKNALQFLHYETLWYVSDELMGRLEQEIRRMTD